MNIKKNAIYGLLLTGLTLTSGCGMIKNLDEMHDATVKGMAKTTENTDKSNSMMGNMCAGQGKLTTSDYRDKLLTLIDEEQDIGRKLSLAVKYNYAWEFQGMSAECGRTNSYSAKVFDESIREYLESMHKFIVSRENTSATSKNNSMNSLYAITATMHYTNSLQEENGEKNGYKPVSMLDLITDAANADAQINAGKLSSYNLPKYVDSGRVLLGDITYLLRIRYNFLTAFAFGLATTNVDGDEATTMGLAKIVLEGMLHRTWSPDFEIKNTRQIQYYGTVLERALNTRAILENMNADLRTDKTIYKIYSSISFSNFDTTPNKADALNVSEKKQSVLRLQGLINDYLTAKDMN